MTRRLALSFSGAGHLVCYQLGAAKALMEKLEEEREKRIAHLQQSAARRMGNAGVLRGWTAWQELYDEQVAQRQMLASAGARLLRPKLAASIAHWRAHWEAAARTAMAEAAEVRALVETVGSKAS